jgi:hypothetical protein
MRVMVIVKATKNSEAGVTSREKLIAEMGKYNEELVKAGVMPAGEGLLAELEGQARRLLRRQEAPAAILSVGYRSVIFEHRWRS